MKEMITYSPSMSIPLTRNCRNRCVYCGFRDERAGLISWEEIEHKAALACTLGASEFLIISGEKPGQLFPVKQDLDRIDMKSFVDFVEAVCYYLLDRGLLPHINIGLLDLTDLVRLRACSASMGLMAEGDYGPVTHCAQPEKIFQERIVHLEQAGQLRIPFTTGLLIGLGETADDRNRSLAAIAEVHQQYGHIQEIIVQPYVPFKGCSLPTHPVPNEEIEDLALLIRQWMPGVHLQFPPNLFENWLDLLRMGFNDMGGIGIDQDVINPEKPWPSIEKLLKTLSPAGYVLQKRLPVYPEYYSRDWCSEKVHQVMESWIRYEDGYRQYLA